MSFDLETVRFVQQCAERVKEGPLALKPTYDTLARNLRLACDEIERQLEEADRIVQKETAPLFVEAVVLQRALLKIKARFFPDDLNGTIAISGNCMTAIQEAIALLPKESQWTPQT